MILRLWRRRQVKWWPPDPLGRTRPRLWFREQDHDSARNILLELGDPCCSWCSGNGRRTSSSRHAITVCYYLSNTSIAIISGLCSLLQHFVNNVFGVLGWRVDHQTMNWQWYILGPWLKYGPWLAIWSIPRGTMFGWPYGLSNQWMATTWLSGWPCLYRNSHQGVNHSLGINLADHMSCWTGKGQQYDFGWL